MYMYTNTCMLRGYHVALHSPFLKMHTGVCEKTFLRNIVHMGILAFRAPHQGLEGGQFLLQDSREKADTKGVFFSQTPEGLNIDLCAMDVEAGGNAAYRPCGELLPRQPGQQQSLSSLQRRREGREGLSLFA